MSRITRTLIAVAVVAVTALAGPAAAAASPDVFATPTTVSFPDQGIYDGNDPIRRVTFEATGPTQVTSVAIVGTDPGQFLVFADQGCTNATLNPGDRCAIDVQFNPTSVGAKSATLRVTDTSGDTDVALSGTGITGALESNPSSITFETRPYFFGQQQQGLNLFAPGPAGVRTTAGTITGPDADRFSIAYGQNCFTQTFLSGNSCGLGVSFESPGPGTFTAQLEISSDATNAPLIVPLSAVALAGPRLVVEPGRIDFGNVGVGQEATQTVRLGNAGDFPLQIQQALFVTGRPDVFFITDDACTARIVNPGEACTLVAHFKPTDAGGRDAALFIIGGNQTQPVDSVGARGTGVLTGGGSPPVTGAQVTGAAVAGGELACRPVGTTGDPSLAYRWLRDGVLVPGQTRAILRLSDADVGARFACELVAGGATLRSAQSAPVGPRDLSRLSGAFTDERTCRTVQAPRALRLGGRRVAIRGGSPVTPAAPLTISASSTVTVSLDGRTLGRGERVKLTPRALADFADGGRTLRVSAGAADVRAEILLAACRLAVRAEGGPGRGTLVAVSSRTGMRTLEVRLPRALRLRAAARDRVGRAWLKVAGYPARRFGLVGPRTSVNGVTVTLTRRGIRVGGLPPETGVVSLRFDAGIVDGRGGSITASATLRGDRAAARAEEPVTWVR